MEVSQNGNGCEICTGNWKGKIQNGHQNLEMYIAGELGHTRGPELTRDERGPGNVKQTDACIGFTGYETDFDEFCICIR